MAKKDTIYIDVEDDITAVIDKVKNSASGVVALVPPKRSSVLESIVNVKLLKRLSEENDKQVVIVSEDKKLVALAGAVGVHVAANLNSKPAIPEVDDLDVDDDVIIEGGSTEPHPQAAVGDLDDKHTGKKTSKSDDVVDEVEAEVKSEDQAAEIEINAEEPTKSKKGIKIPNFESFRAKLMLVAGVFIALIAVIWFVLVRLPAAKIDIFAQTDAVATNFDFTADATRAVDDLDNNTLKAEAQEIKRTITETFTPTGKKDVGEKASGTVTVTNCENNTGITIGAGSTLNHSVSGLNFVTDSDVTVPGSNFSGGGTVCDESGTADVTVTAAESGTDHNVSSGAFSITGLGNVTAFGGQMSGGTSETVTIVAQSDVDGAVAKLLERDDSELKSELQSKFSEGQQLLEATYQKSNATPSVEPAVGQESSQGQVTITVTYSQLAIATSSLEQLVAKQQEGNIDADNKQVVDSGIETADITVKTQNNANKMTLSFATTAYIGPKINIDELAELIANKRFSETKSIIESIEGVNSAEIDYSPFWVSKTPKASRTEINLVIAERE